MRLLIGVCTILLLVTRLSEGQQPSGKPVLDSTQMAQMAGMFNQMGPMYESMMQAMIEGTIKAFEKPETIDRLARFSRRYYEALMKQGFTKEEALQIVAGSGIASMRMAK